MFEAWNVAKGRKVQGGRILSQGTVHLATVSGIVAYLPHLGSACQEVQDPVASAGFRPRVPGLVMSKEGTMVLKAAL